MNVIVRNKGDSIIQNYFSDKNMCFPVWIEGPQGIGKSTKLLYFAHQINRYGISKKHNNDKIFYMINEDYLSKMSYLIKTMLTRFTYNYRTPIVYLSAKMDTFQISNSIGLIPNYSSLNVSYIYFLLIFKARDTHINPFEYLDKIFRNWKFACKILNSPVWKTVSISSLAFILYKVYCANPLLALKISPIIAFFTIILLRPSYFLKANIPILIFDDYHSIYSQNSLYPKKISFMITTLFDDKLCKTILTSSDNFCFNELKSSSGMRTRLRTISLTDFSNEEIIEISNLMPFYKATNLRFEDENIKLVRAFLKEYYNCFGGCIRPLSFMQNTIPDQQILISKY